MPQSERERQLLFMRVIDEAGVARQAKEDALARLETYFQGRDVDAIDVRSHLDTTVRRQAPHLWSQAEVPLQNGAPRAATLAGPDKPRRPQPIELSAAQQEEANKLLPSQRLTYYRELQAKQQR